MAKRRATTELNRDNWDQEDEKEDPGTFKRINEEELKNRVIRKAKRSLVNVRYLLLLSIFCGLGYINLCVNDFCTE